MKIISVLGTASNTGKTTVALYIIRNLMDFTYNQGGRLDNERAKRLGALKITVRHEGACPRHSTCDSCDSWFHANARFESGAQPRMNANGRA